MSPDPWEQIEVLTRRTVPLKDRQGCEGATLVTIPAGSTLYAAGLATKHTMRWGTFAEGSASWYVRGHPLDPDWDAGPGGAPVPIYEYSVVVTYPTPAVRSRLVEPSAAFPGQGRVRFQYYNPLGLGYPVRGRLLGQLRPSELRKALLQSAEAVALRPR